MKKIKLSQGKYALVDNEDYEYLKNYNWIYHIGTKDSYGYAIGTTGIYRGKRMHRVILKAEVGQVIDHKNYNGIDNRKENIRIVTPSENNFNRRVNNKYNHIGIHKTKDRKGNNKYWIARITYNKERIYLGTFKNKKEAIKAWKEAKEKYYGI